MSKTEGASKTRVMEARLQFVWAPVITGLIALGTAVVLHFLTAGKLGDASVNFEKLSAEVQFNRDQLAALEHRVDMITEELLDRRPTVAANGATSDSGAPRPAPALERLKDLRKEMAASPFKQRVNAPPVPTSLFAH